MLFRSPGIWDGLSITKERDFTYPQSKGADLYRRSLYTFWRRTIAPVNMFDSSARQTCRVRTAVTSSPLHALTMLNDPTWVEAARVLAQRVLAGSAADPARLSAAFRLTTARTPTPAEQKILTTRLATLRAHENIAPHLGAALRQPALPGPPRTKPPQHGPGALDRLRELRKPRRRLGDRRGRADQGGKVDLAAAVLAEQLAEGVGDGFRRQVQTELLGQQLGTDLQQVVHGDSGQGGG